MTSTSSKLDTVRADKLAPPNIKPSVVREWVVRSPYREYRSYPSLKEAEDEARGCAKEFPGDEIVVFEAVQVHRQKRDTNA